MGFFTDAIEDISQEPWLIPDHPRREDFLYFRGSSKKSISTYRCVIASYWTFWVLLSILGSGTFLFCFARVWVCGGGWGAGRHGGSGRYLLVRAGRTEVEWIPRLVCFGCLVCLLAFEHTG